MTTWLNTLFIYPQPTLHSYIRATATYPSQQPLSVVPLNFNTVSTATTPAEFVVLTADGNVTPWRRTGTAYQASPALPIRAGRTCAPTDRLVSGNYEAGNGPDLACLSNGPQPSIGRLVNQGNGTFRTTYPLARQTGDSATVLTTIDLNFDFSRLDDALVPRLNDPAGSFAVYPHAQAGGPGIDTWWGTYQFAATIPLSSAEVATSVAAADVNGDGYPDVVVAAKGAAAGTGTLHVRRFLPLTPPFTFQSPAQTYLLVAVPREVRLADLNGDRRPEMLVLGNNGTLSVFTNTSAAGTAVFDPMPETYLLGPDPAIMRVVDADADGDLDVLVPCRGDGTIHILWNVPRILATRPSAFAPGLTVYPNPAQTVLHLDWQGPTPQATATLMDLAGRRVRHWAGQTLPTELAVADLPRGLYVLQLAGALGQTNRRIELR